MKTFGRKEYVRVKKFSYEQMRDFLYTIYTCGHDDGVQEALANEYEVDLDEDTLFKIVCKVPGIGMAKANKIVQAIKEVAEKKKEG